MPKARGLIAVMCAMMVVVPTPVAAQDSHDIEFHALFPGQQSGDALDCSAGEAAYDPLRAGRTLQLTDDTGVVVRSGVLEDVVPPSREGMCETSVTFVEAPDAQVYSVVAGDQAIDSREKVDLEASGWVMRSRFATRTEPTSPATEEEPAASGAFGPTGSLAEARSFHTATLLPDGRVLIVAGFDDDILASAKVWDPDAG